MSLTTKPTSSVTKVSQFGLVMLMAGAVDGVSNLPSIALFGQQLIFFFVLASILFLLPTGLVSAELCKQSPDNSGIYAWTRQAFGGGFAALAVWLQWINTMVWFPTCLTTLVGTIAYLFNPALSHSPVFLVCTSLSVFWTMTWVNMKGVKKSTKIASWATTFGMLIPMGVVIGLSVLWVWVGKPLALHLNQTAILPPLTHTATWTSLTAIITAFLGMELATVHVRKIKNGSVLFPKALGYTMLIIVVTMGLGSLGVALVIPHHDIVLVSGTIQAFEALFNGFHLPWLATVLGVLLIFSSLGTMVNWLISPANGLAQAAGDLGLPKTLACENQHGVPGNILVAQGGVVTLVSFAFFLMPSVNGSYWFLLDLSTELYVAMYILMFISALKIAWKAEKIHVVPGGKNAMIALTLLGLIGCVVAFVVGFFPPGNINVGSASHYTLLFLASFLMMCSPVAVLLGLRKKYAVNGLCLGGV